MTYFLIIALIFIGAPIARAFARSIEHRNVRPSVPESELRKALQSAEQRLSESESRIALVEEKLDFYEKLLSRPRDEPTH